MEDQTARLNLMTGKVRRLRHTQGALLDKIDSLETQLECMEADRDVTKRNAASLSSELCEERASHQKTRDHSAQRMSEINRLSRQSYDRQAEINKLDLEVLQLKEDNHGYAAELDDLNACSGDSGDGPCGCKDCRLIREEKRADDLIDQKYGLLSKVEDKTGELRMLQTTYEELLCKYNELEECREDLQEKYEGKCEDFDTVMDRLKDIDAIIQEEI